MLREQKRYGRSQQRLEGGVVRMVRESFCCLNSIVENRENNDNNYDERYKCNSTTWRNDDDDDDERRRGRNIASSRDERCEISQTRKKSQNDKFQRMNTPRTQTTTTRSSIDGGSEKGRRRGGDNNISSNTNRVFRRMMFGDIAAFSMSRGEGRVRGIGSILNRQKEMKSTPAPAMLRRRGKKKWDNSISDMSIYKESRDEQLQRKLRSMSKHQSTVSLEYKEKLSSMRENLAPYVQHYKQMTSEFAAAAMSIQKVSLLQSPVRIPLKRSHSMNGRMCSSAGRGKDNSIEAHHGRRRRSFASSSCPRENISSSLSSADYVSFDDSHSFASRSSSRHLHRPSSSGRRSLTPLSRPSFSSSSSFFPRRQVISDADEESTTSAATAQKRSETRDNFGRPSRNENKLIVRSWTAEDDGREEKYRPITPPTPSAKKSEGRQRQRLGIKDNVENMREKRRERNAAKHHRTSLSGESAESSPTSFNIEQEINLFTSLCDDLVEALGIARIPATIQKTQVVSALSSSSSSSSHLSSTPPPPIRSSFGCTPSPIVSSFRPSAFSLPPAISHSSPWSVRCRSSSSSCLAKSFRYAWVAEEKCVPSELAAVNNDEIEGKNESMTTTDWEKGKPPQPIPLTGRESFGGFEKQNSSSLSSFSFLNPESTCVLSSLAPPSFSPSGSYSYSFSSSLLPISSSSYQPIHSSSSTRHRQYSSPSPAAPDSIIGTSSLPPPSLPTSPLLISDFRTLRAVTKVNTSLPLSSSNSSSSCVSPSFQSMTAQQSTQSIAPLRRPSPLTTPTPIASNLKRQTTEKEGKEGFLQHRTQCEADDQFLSRVLPRNQPSLSSIVEAQAACLFDNCADVFDHLTREDASSFSFSSFSFTADETQKDESEGI